MHLIRVILHPTVDKGHNFSYTVFMNAMRQFLEDNNLQQKDLADELGYSRAYIYMLASGRKKVTASFVGQVLFHRGPQAAQIFLPYVGHILNKTDPKGNIELK